MAIYPSLKGKIAVVTGAALGIGKATAIELAKQGCAVGLAGKSTSLEEVEGECKKYNVPTCKMYVDLSKEDQVINFVEKINNELGNPTVLVNCAGGFHKMINTVDLSFDEWNEIIGVNLNSAFLCSKYFIPLMQQNEWGRIIMVSSEMGRSPSLLTAPHYVAAKAGMINYARHLAHELGPDNITVNTVAPGPTLSERFLKVRPPEIREQMAKKTPLGRMCEPVEQAHAILFLSSEESSYITGATLDVNGGRLMI